MAFSSLIIVLFVFLLAGVLVIRPFLEDGAGTTLSTSGRYDSLLAERERLYGAIEDLDMAFELQKISEGEHTRGRQDLLKEAAVVLKKIEDHPSYSKKGKKSGRPAAGDDDLELLIAERRKSLQGARADVCPICGQSVSAEDQFCSSCGERLA
jgi:hypothetical protein